MVLLKTLLRLRYGRDVDYSELRGSPEEELERCDAVLLIGDQGLEAMYFPLEGTIRYDLGVMWHDWTGLPMVYAVWAARADFCDVGLMICWPWRTNWPRPSTTCERAAEVVSRPAMVPVRTLVPDALLPESCTRLRRVPGRLQRFYELA